MRITVMGPQNTGKSTFVKDILKEFPHYVTPSESYRDVIEKNGLVINQKSSLESQKAIRDFMFLQIKNNEEYNIVFDRCLIDNFMYSSVLYERGLLPKYFLDETEAMMRDTLPKIDLYLYIPTSVSIKLEDDGTRDINTHFIDAVNKHFLRILFHLARDLRLSIKVISGTRKERIELLKELI